MTGDPSDPEQPPRNSQAPRPSQLPRTSQLPRASQAPSQPPRLAHSAAPDARELVRSTRRDAPSPATRELAVEQVLLRYRRRRAAVRVGWVALSASVALAAGAVLWIRANSPPELQLARELPIAPSQSAAALPASGTAPAPTPSASVRAVELEPCTPAMRATGNEPLIDDFEDDDARIASLEHRAGFWSASNDNTGKQRPAPGGPLAMTRIPGGRGASHFALHTSGNKFTKWGALLAADFSPRRCYDASAYAGLVFFARGRGSFNVVAKMTQIAPEEFGGSCKHDCYDSHRATIPLTNDWQEHRVTWAELEQKGFGQKVPFDPRSLLSLEFTVAPEQTPFDLWIDDIRFLQR